MEELIYLIVKLIVNALSDSKPKVPPVRAADQALQQRIWEQQRRMQQAALEASRKPVAPPPPRPPRVAPPRPANPVTATGWVNTERASRHDGGGEGSSEWSRLVQPGSLQRRFILTEILRPPVSLRPPRI